MRIIRLFIRLVVMLCLFACVQSANADVPQNKARKHVTKTTAKKKHTTQPKQKKQKAEPVFVPTAPEVPEASAVTAGWKPGDICVLCENNPGKCPYCNGSGRKMQVTTEGTTYVKCDKCGGNGICPTCKGHTAKEYNSDYPKFD